MTADGLAALVAMEADGALSSTQVKTVLAELVANGGEPAEIAEPSWVSRPWTPASSTDCSIS